jgi:3-dehydroquinate synthase
MLDHRLPRVNGGAQAQAMLETRNSTDLLLGKAGAKVQVQRFSVPYEYPVVFTRNAFDPDNPTLVTVLRAREPPKRHRAAVFVDDGVLDAVPALPQAIHRYLAVHASTFELVGELVPVPGGERVKNDPTSIQALLEHLAKRSIDRHSFAVAIGGGAVLDAVGFAAAVFHRSVRHVRFPTTVLAQADAGVGVKNAVNAFGIKNLVGTFAPPFAVINDGAFIDHLPPREKRSGMVEAVKVGLIRDGAFFRWIEANAAGLARFTSNQLDALIERSAALHMWQISQGGDPFERGTARPLDYGHWAAHKLESLTRHALSHGEAVAIGVALDTRYSVLSGLLPDGEDERVYKLLTRLGFDLWHEALVSRSEDGRLRVLQGLEDFREHLGGELTVTLLEAVGRGVEVHEIKPQLVEAVIGWLSRKRQ